MDGSYNLNDRAAGLSSFPVAGAKRERHLTSCCHPWLSNVRLACKVIKIPFVDLLAYNDAGNSLSQWRDNLRGT